MHTYSIELFKKKLKELGIKKNDNLYIVTELFRLGRLENAYNNEKYYSLILDIILKIIGSKGTIFVHTYSFDRSSLEKNKNFVSETTKSTLGGLPNLFLKKKIVRSVHPLFSIGALGKNAKFVCENNSTHNYGNLSPYHKMMNIKTKILCLGSIITNNAFVHAAEHQMSAPYMYNKIFQKKVIKKNKIINKTFISFVEYQHLKIEHDFQKIYKLLRNQKLVKQKKINNGYISVCDSFSYFNLLCNILLKDIHGLLKKKPTYKLNRYPYL